MNLYKIENDYVFTNDTHLSREPIAVGDFTDDEIKYCIGFKKGKVIIDSNRKALDESVKAQAIKDEANAPIIAALNNFDLKSIRSIRSVLVALHTGESPKKDDIDKLQEFSKAAEIERKKYIK